MLTPSTSQPLQHGSIIPLDPVAAQFPPRRFSGSPTDNPFSPTNHNRPRSYSSPSASPSFSPDDEVNGHYIPPLTPNNRRKDHQDNDPYAPYRPPLVHEPSTESIRVYSPPDNPFADPTRLNNPPHTQDRSPSGGLNTLSPSRYTGPNNPPTTRSIPQDGGAREFWPPRLFGEVPRATSPLQRPPSRDLVREAQDKKPPPQLQPPFLTLDPMATAEVDRHGNGQRFTQMTTFTDLMEQAGLEKGIGTGRGKQR
ncbi:MAG: hypothetical protein Q9227_000682 [Pyrenula ochraceoflavens]